MLSGKDSGDASSRSRDAELTGLTSVGVRIISGWSFEVRLVVKVQAGGEVEGGFGGILGAGL